MGNCSQFLYIHICTIPILEKRKILKQIYLQKRKIILEINLKENILDRNIFYVNLGKGQTLKKFKNAN